MPLTVAEVKNAKPGPKPYKLTDANGLYLFVTPAGSRVWRFDFQFDQKRKTATFGPFPEIGLADARTKRDEFKAALRQNRNPLDAIEQKRTDAKAATDRTFASLGQEVMDRKRAEGKAESTLVRDQLYLDYLLRAFGERDVQTVTSAEIYAVLKVYEKAGKLEAAKRMRGLASEIYRLAITTGRASTDPTSILVGAIASARAKGRAAITDETKLSHFLRELPEYDGWPAIRLAIEFLTLTFVRPVEARLAQWDEFDLERKAWAVPAGRMKMRRDHDVPLSTGALAVLAEAKALYGGKGLVFPSPRAADRPLSENTFNTAMRRMGWTKEEVTAHGFRATASTLMNKYRMGSEDAIEMQLAHVNGGVRAIYNRYRYWEERVALMQKWSDYLQNLRGAS